MLSVINQNPKPIRSSCPNNFSAKTSNSLLGLSLQTPSTPVLFPSVCVCLKKIIVYEVDECENLLTGNEK